MLLMSPDMLIEFLLQNAILCSMVAVLGCASVYMWTTGGDKNMLDPDSAIAAINSDQAQILDLRPRAEFDRGHIPGARLTDAAKVKAIAKNKTVLLVCARGATAATTARQLRADGCTGGILVLKGGMTAWQQDSKPTTIK